MDAALLASALAWLDDDPDPVTQAELHRLIDADDEAAVADRFDGRLQFGTAGLRGELGAGPMRMNRVTVIRAAAGLARYLLDTDPQAAERGVLIGYDARHNSDVFALDSARVLAGAGIRALLLPRPMPTPVLAWGITKVDATAGVMVTASHNPAADNGYKVYLGDGVQIVPPADSDIAACIDAVGPIAAVLMAPPESALIEYLDDAVVEAYLDHVPSVRHAAGTDAVQLAYTPLHGVGGRVAMEAFRRAGFASPAVVVEQFEPNPDFPGLPFPNPEEPGTMDALLALAASIEADVALANDPDADRMAAAIPLSDGTWRALNGDEIGWLLAEHLLARTTGDDRLVVTTVVSSTLLADMAAAAGVHHAEVFTGFKWIGHYVHDHPELRFVLGYEQALGYLVATTPLDKDGITAAVLMAEVAAVARAEGTTIEGRLEAIAERFGRHVTSQRSVKLAPSAMGGLMDALRAAPPAMLGGHDVTEVTDFPEANLLRYSCGPTVRVQVRPSGTEPKVKLYAELVDGDPEPYLDDLEQLLLAHGR